MEFLNNISFTFILKIIAVTILLSSGEVATYSAKANSDIFPAIICSLGCLGIIINVQFKCERRSNVKHIKYALEFEDVKPA